jgi:long-chain fatty acid transport protein
MKITLTPTVPGLRRVLTCALAALFASLHPAAQGSGTRVGYKDAFATARGDAFTATADDPSAIVYNPAGLTQLEGAQVSANVYEVSLSSDYTGAGGSASVDDAYQSIPSFYATWRQPGSPVGYGIGVYAPFGLSTDWPNNSPLRTLALRNVQKLVTYNFSVGWQIDPTFSAGYGLTYTRGTTDLRRALGIFGPSDLFRFEGTGEALGFDLGLMWKPNPENSIGFRYSHHMSIKYKGVSDTIPLITGEPADATFQYPEVVVLGWSYRPTPQWNLEADLDWTNWDRLNTVTVHKASGDTALPFNWQSGFFYELGVTRYLTGGWNVSAGFNYTENNTPDSTFTPAVPDSTKIFYSLGVGYKGQRFSADLAWQYGDGGSRHVTGSPPSLIGATADGTYRTHLNALSLSLGLRF